jgi:hypothetical protein
MVKFLKIKTHTNNNKIPTNKNQQKKSHHHHQDQHLVPLINLNLFPKTKKNISHKSMNQDNHKNNNKYKIISKKIIHHFLNHLQEWV